MFKKIRLFLISRFAMYVIADPRDNSITLSRRLCRDMDIYNLSGGKVIVFRTDTPYGLPEYGFSADPDITQQTQLCDLQYNVKHKCIGFETLCPTVGRIFYDYLLPPMTPCRIYVKRRTTAGGMRYYALMRNNSPSYE